jgi:feruloyl-CoA synthase
MTVDLPEATDPGAAPLFATPDIDVEHRSDGSWLLRSKTPLRSYNPSLGALLEAWAGRRPDTAFLCERDTEGGWRRVTFGEAWSAARAIGQTLLERNLGNDRPVMVLSANAVDQALLQLGATWPAYRSSPSRPPTPS